MTRTLTAMLLFLAAGLATAGPCRLTEREYAGFRSLVLDNGCVEAILVPGYNGLIAEYNFKPTVQKMFMDLQLQKFRVSDALVFTETNYGGFKDWFWESGLVRAALKYDARIVRNTPDEISVCLSYDRGQVRIERYVSLRRDSTVLSIETVITGTLENPVTLSYWPHNMLRKLEDGEKFLIPLAKVSGQKRKGVDVYNFDRIKEPGVYDIREIAAKNQELSFFFVPAQDWWGVVRKDGTVLVQEIPDIGPLQEGDGLFYTNYTKDQQATQEVIFQAEKFGAGTVKRYRINYCAAAGFSSLDYAGSGLMLAVGRAERTGGGIRLPIRVAAPEKVRGGRLLLTLDDGSAVETAVVALPVLSPERSEPVTAVFASARAGAGARPLTLRFEFTAAGKCRASGVINRSF